MITMSTDTDRVAGFIGAGHTERHRVFVPVETEQELVFERWSSLAESAGVDLNERLHWLDVTNAMSPDRVRDLHPASGEVDVATAQVLCAMWSEFAKGSTVNVAMWPGYAGDLEELPVSLRRPDLAIAANYGGLSLQVYEPEWLMTRTIQHRLHFPIFTWPKDHSIMVSCPIYSNSLYVSGPAGIGAKLRSRGLDVVSVRDVDMAIQICSNDLRC